MSRFPSPGHARQLEDCIQELDDGFERLGDQDTPFTLRNGGDNQNRAQQLHNQRETAERERDEESNEPVTRTLSEWRENKIELDFPFVDTIPIAEQRNRADQVAGMAIEEAFVQRIDRGVDFREETVRGKYWRGIGLIELGTDPDDFPGFQAGVVLAHELGHAFYGSWSPNSGIEEQDRLFQTTDEREQARAISERLHGPMIDTEGPFVDYRLGSDEELAAAVFASRIIEPMAAQRIAPDAVRRLESVFGGLSDSLF